MDFSRALKKLRKGKTIRRQAWRDGEYISLSYGSTMEQKYLTVRIQKYHQAGVIDSYWYASPADMMSTDWEVCVE